MKLRFLGDALDHWKGSIFEYLQHSNLLRDFAVDPMAGDWHEWKPEHHAAFARLLRVEKEQIISHSAPLENREDYFLEVAHRGDLFLDPDTGIATSRVKDKDQYVTPAEIKSLLGESERVVAVYQHISRNVTARRVDEVCRCLNGAIEGLHWASYESATVAMMFFSRSHSRLAEIAIAFKKLLGDDAGKRVRVSTDGSC